MELVIPPPKARYGVITLNVIGHSGEYVEIGPVLAASYDRRVFEVLYPFRAVVEPLNWEIHEQYGPLESPAVAIWRYLKDKAAAEAVVSQDFDRLYGEGTDVDWKVTELTIQALLEREVGER